MRCQNPFPIPDHLGAKLQEAFLLWQGLKRAENGIPFSDDLGVPALSGLSGEPFLLRAFVSPERYCFEFLGGGSRGRIAPGTFIDEISPDVEFSYLRAQSSATIEAAEPALLRLAEMSGRNFSRLLLPLWGNGQIDLLLGATDRLRVSRTSGGRLNATSA